jgi:hypothetical protein
MWTEGLNCFFLSTDVKFNFTLNYFFSSLRLTVSGRLSSSLLPDGPHFFMLLFLLPFWSSFILSVLFTRSEYFGVIFCDLAL